MHICSSTTCCHPFYCPCFYCSHITLWTLLEKCKDKANVVLEYKLMGLGPINYWTCSTLLFFVQHTYYAYIKNSILYVLHIIQYNKTLGFIIDLGSMYYYICITLLFLVQHTYHACIKIGHLHLTHNWI